MRLGKYRQDRLDISWHLAVIRVVYNFEPSGMPYVSNGVSRVWVSRVWAHVHPRWPRAVGILYDNNSNTGAGNGDDERA